MYNNPYNFSSNYNPIYNQVMQTPYSSMQNSQNLIRVNGIEGAKAYQMGANSTVALFDANEDLMYIKSSDGAGFPSIRTFKFEEVKGNVPNISMSDYVTRKEFNELVEVVKNGKLTIPATAEPETTAN